MIRNGGRDIPSALGVGTSRQFKALSVVCHVIQSSSSLQLTVMAAGALLRSRGAAGVRTTKGLYFIFTLLCLVCLASSLTITERLEKAKKMLKNLEQKTAKAKAEYESNHGFHSEMMDEYMQFMDPLIAITEQTAPYLPLLELMDKLKIVMKKSKVYMDKSGEEMAAHFRSREQKVREYKQLIKYLEEKHNEL
ncbi:uncharacterized protein LOC127379198 isoform X4 [Scomber scombrus]|uniref:Uncharacterized protein LOC127379198 isoform X4 n=1 Tax=Scomber scombrus TaxID=13677 RepID=A0AAV1P954_SCOSC